MKNARKYERKIKRLLAPAAKMTVAPPPKPPDLLEVLLTGILQADAQAKPAEKALAVLKQDFVDLNEVRVAQAKEIAESVGRGYPEARRKGEMITHVLNAIFDRTGAIRVDYMGEMAKRDLRRHLLELGLDRYASAYMAMMAFDAHAVCVDDTLAGCLEMDGYIAPGSSVADVQGFLERVVSQKTALAAHEVLRAYADRRGRALAKKQRAEAERLRARQAAQAEAEAAAEARAAAQAAEKQLAEEAKPRAKARPRKTARRPKQAKPAPKPAEQRRSSGRQKPSGKPPSRAAKRAGRRPRSPRKRP